MYNNLSVIPYFPPPCPLCSECCTPLLCFLTSFQTRELLYISHKEVVPYLCSSLSLAYGLFLVFLYPLGGEGPELHIVFERQEHHDLTEGRGDVICSLYFYKIVSYPPQVTCSVLSKAVYCHPLAIMRMILFMTLFASPAKLP